MQSLLFGVDPLDPVPLVTATVTLVLVSAVAIAIPSLKAARVTPDEALRAE